MNSPALPPTHRPTSPVRSLWVGKGRIRELDDAIAAGREPLPEEGFGWIDTSTPEADDWIERFRVLSGASLFDEHVLDARNALHRPFFDQTSQYEMLIVRALADDGELDAGDSGSPEASDPADGTVSAARHRTEPLVIFVTPRGLLTVHHGRSSILDALRERLREPPRGSVRGPLGPEELMLRIVDEIVDRYLVLREPLTESLNAWQRRLLHPRKDFRDWTDLLEERAAMSRLEHLAEQQYDAIQSWAESRRDIDDALEPDPDDPPADSTPDFAPLDDRLRVRVANILEHIARIQILLRRLENGFESSIQLHFSATAHRTSEIMRLLTVLTAVFMPLTLITGIFGMNFDPLPGAKVAHGFWFAMAAMGGLAIALIALFRTLRYLDDPIARRRRRRRRH